MNSVYASKLFRSSSRKAQIRSAIENPVNVELVQQLRTYLDDEYLTTKYFPRTADTSPGFQTDRSESSENFTTADSYQNSSATFPFDSNESENPHPMSSQISGDPESMFPFADEASDTSMSLGTEDVEIAESTQVTTSNTSESFAEFTAEDVSNVRKLLEANPETCDIARVRIKSQELWIYYSDFVNLNVVMGPALDVLADSDYKNLQFNRLARTDNAIVLEIPSDDVSRGVQND